MLTAAVDLVEDDVQEVAGVAFAHVGTAVKCQYFHRMIPSLLKILIYRNDSRSLPDCQDLRGKTSTKSTFFHQEMILLAVYTVYAKMKNLYFCGVFVNKRWNLSIKTRFFDGKWHIFPKKCGFGRAFF